MLCEIGASLENENALLDLSSCIQFSSWMIDYIHICFALQWKFSLNLRLHVAKLEHITFTYLCEFYIILKLEDGGWYLLTYVYSGEQYGNKMVEHLMVIATVLY